MPLYVAFGSNLDLTQMRLRCPSARLVGTAHIPGYRLAFAGQSASWGGGTATLQAAAGRASAPGVPVAVYSLSSADLAELDRYEGHPWHYGRVLLQVVTRAAPDPLACWAYVLPESCPAAAPTAAYVERIASGYDAHGFDRRVLMDAVRRAASAGGDGASSAEATRSADGELVLVYGSLLRGMHNHGVLARCGATLLGSAVTTQRAFTMRSLGAFPAVSRGGRNAIRGEVYRVGGTGLAALDRLEGHPSWYRRERVEVQLGTSRERPWTYLLDAPGPVVPDGDWRSFAAGRGAR